MMCGFVGWGNFHQIQPLGVKFPLFFPNAMRSIWNICNCTIELLPPSGRFRCKHEVNGRFPNNCGCFVVIQGDSTYHQQSKWLHVSSIDWCIWQFESFCFSWKQVLLSQLKEVKVYKVDWENKSWHPVELKSGELATTKLQEWEKFYFLLNWWCNLFYCKLNALNHL